MQLPKHVLSLHKHLERQKQLHGYPRAQKARLWFIGICSATTSIITVAPWYSKKCGRCKLFLVYTEPSSVHCKHAPLENKNHKSSLLLALFNSTKAPTHACTTSSGNRLTSRGVVFHRDHGRKLFHTFPFLSIKNCNSSHSTSKYYARICQNQLHPKQKKRKRANLFNSASKALLTTWQWLWSTHAKKLSTACRDSHHGASLFLIVINIQTKHNTKTVQQWYHMHFSSWL